MSRHYFTDTPSARLQYVGDSTHVEDLTPQAAETVRLSTPWESFFDTDEFVRFEATVAKPIVQPYFHDGELYQFKKPADELQRAQPQIDNTPWTMGHPPSNTVTTPDQIRGFWADPEWTDGQDARLFIPANDAEAVRYAIHNDEVSIGFSAALDWTNDEETSSNSASTTSSHDDGASTEFDARQVDFIYDHIASVENGRCPPEEGCGLHTDSSASSPFADAVSVHGHSRPEVSLASVGATVADAEHNAEGTSANRSSPTPTTDDGMDPDYSEGDWVRWGWSGGSAVGIVRTVSTEQALSSSGATRDPSEKGEPAYKIEHYDTDAESLGNMKVAYESNLEAASEPDSYADAVRTIITEDAEHEIDADHLYDTRSAAEEAAAELDCSGAHKHETDEGEMWMPCSSMDAFRETTAYTQSAHQMDDASCGCPTPSGTTVRTTADAQSSPTDDDGNGNSAERVADHLGRECSEGPCRCGLHVAGDAEINGTTIDLTVPESAQSAADAFLEASEVDGLIPSDCGTGAGTTSAEMIASGEVTADRLVSDIAPYLHSHEEDVSTDTHPSNWSTEPEADTPWKDCGDAQYAAWGWTSLLDWARRKADEIKRAMGEDPVYTDSVDHLDVVDASIMDTITYRGIAAGQLVESEIPTDDYEDHYVFAGDTKSDSTYPLVDAEGDLRRGNVAAAWEVYGHAEDESLLLDVLAEANARIDNHEGMSAPIPEDSLRDAMAAGETDAEHHKNADTDDYHDAFNTMSNSDDDDPTLPDDPTAFYDGEPTIEDLADDFTAVESLVDAKEDLEDTVEDLQDSLHEYRLGEFRDKAEELAELLDRDVEAMVESYEDGDLTIAEVEDKIEVATEARSTEPTTVGDSDDARSIKGRRARGEYADDADEPAGEGVHDATDDAERISRTPGGKMDLSSVRSD